jgi:hypothetical protein
VSPLPSTRRPSQGGTRVVLIKPGDVLLIGNVGSDLAAASRQALDAMAESFEKVGILAFAFAGDIELAKVPGMAEQIAADRAKGGYLPAAPVSEHDPATCTTCQAARLEPSDKPAHP